MCRVYDEKEDEGGETGEVIDRGGVTTAEK